MKRFDGAACWRDLPDEVKEQVGALVVEWAYSAIVVSELDEIDDAGPSYRAVEFAEGQLQIDLLELLSEHLEVDDSVAIHGVAAIAVPSLIGPVCRECGCSNNDACAGGCSWACDDLCSTCKITTPATGAIV